jgi:hypothetical protein
MIAPIVIGVDVVIIAQAGPTLVEGKQVWGEHQRDEAGGEKP